MKIPKTIIQTCKDSSVVNQQMQKAVNTWKDKNPDWSYRLFYDEDCKKFLKKHFNSDVYSAFDIIKPGAGKADLFRYCYLYIKGGVYVDIDNICLMSLSEIIEKDSEFISILDKFPGINHSFTIHQSFIASTPKHDFLDKAVMLCVYNILNKAVLPNSSIGVGGSFPPLLKITGTKLLADAVNISLKKPLNSPFVQDEVFPFTRYLVNKKFPPESIIQDKNGNNIIQCGYNGYDPGTHWLKSKLYNK